MPEDVCAAITEFSAVTMIPLVAVCIYRLKRDGESCDILAMKDRLIESYKYTNIIE
jgi:hypothetical protein